MFRYFSSDISVNAWNTNHVYGHYTQITNPLKTFSVYEAAINGCEKNATATVEHAAKIRYFVKCNILLLTIVSI